MVWVNILRFSIQGNTCVSIWATSVQEQLELVGTCLGPYLLTLSYWPFSKTYCNCKCFSAREKKTSHSFLGGGNSNIFHFHPYLGKNPFWRAYFSNGLVQPPTRFPFQKIPSKFGMDFFYDSMGFRSEILTKPHGIWFQIFSPPLSNGNAILEDTPKTNVGSTLPTSCLEDLRGWCFFSAI